MEDSYLLGKLGEERAARYLNQKGYSIMARNYRYRKAEIDLIARKDNTLVICEVKTRTGTALERIPEAINRRKRERLVEAADHFIIYNGLQVETRFDIIWLTRDSGRWQLEHMEDAFYHF